MQMNTVIFIYPGTFSMSCCFVNVVLPYKTTNCLFLAVSNSVATLRQLLINHMDGQEDVDRDRERVEALLREPRAGSLQGLEENFAPSSSVENGAERTETLHTRTENRHELPSGDTGFFETSEDFGEIR